MYKLALHYWYKISDIHNLKEKGLILTQFQSFQSIVGWLQGNNLVIYQWGKSLWPGQRRNRVGDCLHVWVIQESPRTLNYNDRLQKEKFISPQTIDCWWIQNFSQLCDHSDVVEISSCTLYLNLKIHFHWENVALKWATLWSISFCSFVVWLTIHFNKQVAVELLSARVSGKAHSSSLLAVINFYLFFKASWISAHCSVGNHICFI